MLGHFCSSLCKVRTWRGCWIFCAEIYQSCQWAFLTFASKSCRPLPSDQSWAMWYLRCCAMSGCVAQYPRSRSNPLHNEICTSWIKCWIAEILTPGTGTRPWNMYKTKKAPLREGPNNSNYCEKICTYCIAFYCIPWYVYMYSSVPPSLFCALASVYC